MWAGGQKRSFIKHDVTYYCLRHQCEDTLNVTSMLVWHFLISHGNIVISISKSLRHFCRKISGDLEVLASKQCMSLYIQTLMVLLLVDLLSWRLLENYPCTSEGHRKKN